MPPTDKKLEKLQKLLEVANEDFATHDDLIQLSEAILSVITTEKKALLDALKDGGNDNKKEQEKVIALLGEKEKNLKLIITRLTYETEQAIATVDSRLSKTLSSEIKRLERKIPTKTDLTGLESEISAIKEGFNTLPTELTINNEAIRDGLELLQGDERLDKSAIKGLDDLIEDLRTIARTSQPQAVGVRLLRYLSDVNIEGITNGQTLIWNSTTNRFEPGSGGGGASPLTTKGDLYTYSTADARLPVGSNGQVLSVDSAESTGLKWIALAGGGDMVLAASQIVSGLKTYLAGTLGLRNVANTFTSFFTNTNTASRTYTLQNVDGTVALTVQDVDYEVTDTTKGIILKSANGTRWRIGITNNGELTAVSL